MLIKGPELVKHFRAQARKLVKGKGRLLTFALITSGDSPSIGGGAPVILRAYYGTLGEDGGAAVKHEEEYV